MSYVTLHTQAKLMSGSMTESDAISVFGQRSCQMLVDCFCHRISWLL